MKRTTLFTVTAALVVVAVLAIALAVQYTGGNLGRTVTSSASSSLTSSGSTFSTNSVQGGNQTYVATFQSATEESTTATTATSSSSSASASSASSSTTFSSSITTSGTQSQNNGDSYSYTASSQVRILSVEATVSGSQQGESAVSFWVRYENIGNSDIYVVEGDGSGLNATITSGASLIKEFAGARCMIVVVVGPLSPGSNQTAFTPGCWSGYQFELLEPGTIGVQLTLSWSTGLSQGEKGSITISAEFALS